LNPNRVKSKTEKLVPVASWDIYLVSIHHVRARTGLVGPSV